ncbi:hypothetical protein SRABI26_04279 [Arthrobacter sp. Bi26]|uniref:DUF6602 domain-containing protein n=1 Tax=Arthrobacter sp. Bi26 TaxID=2822350 RepID=UPI001D60C293|nr:DUF6602 domain-containing protein [Arthrobacter sp. Bi26]CAH0292648.1 hypothetical protein SRABI26_04279 [Arthrobacter sp. Bi26]
MGHEHHQWLEDASADIQRDYERLYKKAADSKNTQLVGHENEGIWDEFLRNWLPPQYEVATRKYIVGTADADIQPFETDLIVFHPGYPRKLRQKTRVLAAGVAAAFSTKLTIRASGLEEAAQQSAALQRALIPTRGRARLELWKPYVFGILAASHPWKKDASTPSENVLNAIVSNDKKYANHPAECLDLVCIADLGTWAKSTSYDESLREIPESLRTTHFEVRADPGNTLSVFLSALYEHLSWANEDMKGMANSFVVTNEQITGRGMSRGWDPSEALTKDAHARLRHGEPFSRNGLDSWRQGVL